MPKAKKSQYGFRLENIEPRTDIAWVLAGPQGHKAYWREAARIALAVKDRSLARGLGVDGGPLAEISEYTRRHRVSAMGRARASAPPLTPARRLSRTRSYLRAFPDETGVWMSWRFDHRTGMSWGQILSYQARRGRDVIGLSDDDRAEIARRMTNWWRRERLKYAVRGAMARREPLDPMAMLLPTAAVQAPRTTTAARSTRPVNLDLATFHSDRQASEYARAVAEGRNRGPNRGDQPRTTRRLIKR